METLGAVSGLILLVAPNGSVRAAMTRPGRLGLARDREVPRERKLERDGVAYTVEDPIEILLPRPAADG
jgi:hypothetical protein